MSTSVDVSLTLGSPALTRSVALLAVNESQRPLVNAATPSGVPRPVGPSYPFTALHRDVPQAPLLPPVISNNGTLCFPEPATALYGSELKLERVPSLLPASAYTEPTIGAATLVPPTTSHPDSPNVSYTHTPVLGSATAETSATVRFRQ